MEEYTQERLDAVQEELNEALNEWQQRGMDISNWRMGNQELLIRMEILVLMDIIQDRFEIDTLELDIRLKEKFVGIAREMFPAANEMRRDAVRQQIVDGIPPIFRPKGEG